MMFLSALTGGCMSDRECQSRIDWEADQCSAKIVNLEKKLCVYRYITEACPVINIPSEQVCPR